MKNDNFKELYDKIQPDEDLKHRVCERVRCGMEKQRAVRRRRKATWIPILSCCMVLVMLIGMVTIRWDIDTGEQRLVRFTSYTEAEDYIKDRQEENTKLIRSSRPSSIGCSSKNIEADGGSSEMLPPTMPDSEGSAGNNGGHSETNTQVLGVDEADIVKTDGKNIYSLYLSEEYYDEYDYYNNGKALNSQLVVTNVKSKTITKTDFTDTRYTDMYLFEKRLVLIGYKRFDMSQAFKSDKYSFTVKIYDVTDSLDIKEIKNISYENMTLVSSRRIEKKLYFVLKNYDVMNSGELIIPTANIDGEKEQVAPTDMYAIPSSGGKNTVLTTMIMLDLQGGDQLDFKSFYGIADNMYANKDAIYLTSNDNIYKRNVFNVVSNGGSRDTVINRFDIGENGFNFHSNTYVNGSIINQFAMDEYDGAFRIATTLGYNNGGAKLSVLEINEDSLELVGSVEGMGKANNERIYSVRFEKEYCYLVTARTTDPLYVVDVTDKANPKVKSELKIPDVSDYMHMYNDNTIIGVGRQAQGGQFYGVQVTLFDVKDKQSPIKLDQIKYSTMSSSEVINTHKAYLGFEHENGSYLFGFPIYDNQNFGFVLLSTNGEKLIEVGALAVEFSGDWVYNNMNNMRSRGVIVQNTVYLVGNNIILYADILEDAQGNLTLSEAQKLTINEALGDEYYK